MEGLVVGSEEAHSIEAIKLMRELSEKLKEITGETGEDSFNLDDMNNSRSLFAICRYQGQPVGCGALRPLNETTAELKRMYSRKNGMGVGSKILSYLEKEAINLNYFIIRLETQKINKKAIHFYKSKGYTCIPNYGRCIGRTDAICFEKLL
ncbi:GNAT superfamily N-acetyltransferase [Peribacillus deserti]|uniref:GNAT superfamily N-acetyltransferase n=1 Tax=Peribacillus deserti TaxID=673318 RepID=A0ABS2QKL9_9BACI|nr:GNAT superfamily N-acetyltransferase [Peribacillus deserti]